MKNKKAIIIGVLLVGTFIVFIAWGGRPAEAPTARPTVMLITSPSFENNGRIPKKFTCDGGNLNPELQIQNVPAGAKSLALIMHDPDAPMPGGFTHWVVWNIDQKTARIKEESAPQGSAEGNNTRGPGYTGPCPPSGTHHYEFRLYALDTMLTLAPASGKAELEAAMQGHIIEQARLVGLYARGQ